MNKGTAFWAQDIIIFTDFLCVIFVFLIQIQVDISTVSEKVILNFRIVRAVCKLKLSIHFFSGYCYSSAIITDRTLEHFPIFVAYRNAPVSVEHQLFVLTKRNICALKRFCKHVVTRFYQGRLVFGSLRSHSNNVYNILLGHIVGCSECSRYLGNRHRMTCYSAEVSINWGTNAQIIKILSVGNTIWNWKPIIISNDIQGLLRINKLRKHRQGDIDRFPIIRRNHTLRPDNILSIKRCVAQRFRKLDDIIIRFFSA